MRRFITADEIRKTAREGLQNILNGRKTNEAVINVEKDDVVTAEAYDLARTLGVVISYETTRRPLICANFKMNGGPGFLDKYSAELAGYMAQFYPGYAAEIDLVIAPPAPLVPVAYGLSARKTIYSIAGQNAYIKESGAYTGEISPHLLKECGADFVIIGHSERRKLFGETDALTAQKLKIAIDAGLTPILCAGENLEDRQTGRTFTVIEKMLSALYSVPMQYSKQVTLAYEPVWAIGTGVNAANDQIAEVCGFIRKNITEKLGTDFSKAIRILYGGSVNETNALEISSIKGIDGALVGGASLKAVSFARIAAAFKPRGTELNYKL